MYFTQKSAVKSAVKIMANIKIIKNKKGISFQVDIRIKGYRRIVKTFFDENPKKAKNEAVAFANETELKMRKGTFKTADESVNILNIDTMYQLIDYFEKNIAPSRYSYSDKYTVMFNWWKNQIGHIKVKELSSPVLSACKQTLMSEKVQRGKSKKIVRGNNTINKYLMCLSAILSWAVKELEIIEVNPMSKISMMKKPNGRTRRLQPDEMQKFALECKNHSDAAFLFFLLLLYTGGRYSEVLHLSIETIDFKNSRVSYINTKNKTHRSVGIDSNLLNMIINYIEKKKIKSGYIFYNNKSNNFIYMRGVFQNIIKKIGLDDFHIHDLRHTFASTVAEEGASLLDIAMLLGHKSLTMARRYSHLTQQHTDNIARNAAKVMHIDNI